MTFQATKRTAFVAGMWTGLVSLVYLYLAPKMNLADQERLWHYGVFLVGFVPVLPFVFGLDDFGKSSLILSLRDRITIFLRIMKRGLFWLLGAAVVGMPGSVILRYVANAT